MWFFVPYPICVDLIHTGPKPVHRSLDPSVPPPMLLYAVPPPFSRYPRVLPPLGDILFPLTLLDLVHAASAIVSAPSASAADNADNADNAVPAADNAALVPPAVQYFGCVAVIVRMETIFRIYY